MKLLLLHLKIKTLQASCNADNNESNNVSPSNFNSNNDFSNSNNNLGFQCSSIFKGFSVKQYLSIGASDGGPSGGYKHSISLLIREYTPPGTEIKFVPGDIAIFSSGPTIAPDEKFEGRDIVLIF